MKRKEQVIRALKKIANFTFKIVFGVLGFITNLIVDVIMGVVALFILLIGMLLSGKFEIFK